MDKKRQRIIDAVRTHRDRRGSDSSSPIAIIGLSGYLPGCSSVADFWRALDRDQSLIEEIPRERFDWRGVYDPSGSDLAKSHTKWGGFIPEIDMFDRELFGMSRTEAERTDPRLRLLLMSVYNTLEDAGYAPQRLRHSATGVFVAVEDDEYLQTLADAGLPAVEPFSRAPCMVANSLSRFYDFLGASEIVNTMCSGAAVALHRAVLALRAGEIDQAIVGAANLLLRPDLFVGLSRLQQLSPRRTVKSFGDRAEGYLRAEGVASILLKPLPQAESDGDLIYATIRNSAVNFNGQGGMSTAAPNVASHADLMLGCYMRGDIDPASLTYIEAQGMGNQVADIAEWDAFNRALKRLAVLKGVTLPPGHCRVSTLKPMIGHMHSASALGAVFKVIRSFQTDRIYRIIDFDLPNRFLDLRDQPCRLAEATESWSGTTRPRLAAVHSYGSGGSNAHIVLEEHRHQPDRESARSRNACYVLPLSSGTTALCVELAERLLVALEDQPELSLDAVAQTLQRGRDHMRVRAAFVADSPAAFRQQLRAYVSRTPAPGVYEGDIHIGDQEGHAGQPPVADTSTPHGRFHRCARQWAAGHASTFDAVVDAGVPPRARLPVYPFNKERYWIGRDDTTSEPDRKWLDHPVFRIQRVDGGETKCRIRLDSSDFYLDDHRLRDRRILPAAAYLEIARMAASACAEMSVTRLTDIAWQSALFVDNRVELELDLVHRHDDELDFTFTSPVGTDTSRVVHGRGALSCKPALVPPRVDLAAIARRCGPVVSADAVYQQLTRAGFGYGPRFRGLRECWFSEQEALGKIALPPSLSLDDGVVLHPSLLDSALQIAALVVLGATDRTANSGDPLPTEGIPLPFSIDEVVIHRPLPRELIVHARLATRSGSSLLIDSDLCTGAGDVVVSLRGIYLRPEPSTEVSMVERDVRASHHARVALERLVWLEGNQDPVASTEPALDWKRVRLRLGAYLAIPDSELVAVDSLEPDDALLLLCDVLAERLRAGPAADVHHRYLLELWCDRSLHSSTCDGIVSYLKSIRAEYPHVHGKLIRLETDSHSRPGEAGEEGDRLLPILAREQADAKMSPEVSYKEGRRYVRTSVPLDHLDAAHDDILAHPGKTYCVIGGGRLGHELATFLNQRFAARVLVASRTGQVSPARGTDVPQVEDAHPIRQVALDVTDRAGVESFVSMLEDADVEGIFFTAGVLRPGATLQKTAAQMKDVIWPKASGALNVLRQIHRCSCRFVALFSSRACEGEQENSDYAAANGFLNGLALEFGPGAPPTWTNKLGQPVAVVSIDWPHWQAGGMQLGPEVVDLLRVRRGVAPLPTATGLELLRDIVRSSVRQIALAYRTNNRSEHVTPLLAAHTTEPDHAIEAALRKVIGGFLGVPPSEIAMDVEFGALGLTSISVVNICLALQKEHQISVRPSAFFACGTVHDLQRHIVEARGKDPSESADRAERRRPASRAEVAVDQYEPIAIVGMDARFPGAENVEQFWKNVVSGKRCITEAARARRPWQQIASRPGAEMTGIDWGAFLEGVDEFDPLFFSIAPAEAALMDPQQRLLLQSVWSALEHGGLPPDRFASRTTGVFVAAGPGEYGRMVTIPDDHPLGATAVAPSIAPARISHAFNFTGPSEYCDTACSSALVALHRAIRAMHLRECEQAIVTSINLLLLPETARSFQAMEYLSADGVCRPFQPEANGFVRGEGVGSLVLKPLQRAMDEHDTVYAVIRGSAVFHGGRGLSLTAPNGKGLERAMVDAYRHGNVDPRTVSYIELHGVSSPVSDAVEVSAIKAAYRELITSDLSDQPLHICRLGSLKPCIGHGEHVSGMASLIKVICALRYRELPGLPGFTRLHDDISLDDSPFEMAAANRSWVQPAGGRRRASVNSFGFGGVNAHVVLEEMESVAFEPDRESDEESQVIVLSARSPERLKEASRRMLCYLESEESSPLADVAYTLQAGRLAMGARLAFVARTKADAVRGLKRYLDGSPGNAPGEPEIHTGFVTQTSAPGGAADRFREAGSPELQPDAIDHTLIARDWVCGCVVTWERMHRRRRRRVALPTYPFARDRYWLSAQTPALEQGPPRVDLTLHDRLVGWLSGELGIATEAIDDAHLADLGCDSIVMVRLRRRCEEWSRVAISVPELFSLGTVGAIAACLSSRAIPTSPSYSSLSLEDLPRPQATDPLDLFQQGLMSLEDVATLISREQG